MFLCVALISFNVCSVLLDASFMSSCCQFSVPLFFFILDWFQVFLLPMITFSVSLCRYFFCEITFLFP